MIIKPDFIKDLSWVKGEYQSLYGTIKSQWKRENNFLTLNVEIPANTTATIILPADNIANIAENGNSLINNKDFKLIPPDNGKTIIQTGSGNYSFRINENH